MGIFLRLFRAPKNETRERERERETARERERERASEGVCACTVHRINICIRQNHKCNKGSKLCIMDAQIFAADHIYIYFFILLLRGGLVDSLYNKWINNYIYMWRLFCVIVGRQISVQWRGCFVTQATSTERLMLTSFGTLCKGYHSPNVVVCGRLFNIKFRKNVYSIYFIYFLLEFIYFI